MGHANERNPGWKGEEVKDAPPGAAERAAERAEGNAPVRADADRKRRAHETPAQEPEDEIRRQPSGESPEDKIAEAAEEHQEREAAGNRPPHGKL